MTEKLLIALIAGLLLWVVKATVSHWIKRTRFRAALLVDIKSHLEGAKEQKGATKVLVEETIEVGKKVPFPISYFIDSYNFYSSVQKELPSYLTEAELVKVIKFYQAIWQLDVSLNGLATTIGVWERDGENITKANIVHLKKRLARVTSFCDCLTAKEINKISDLPDDYRQVKDAETVVAKT